MSRVRGFTPWRPQRRTRDLIESVQEILDEYAAYLPLTIRQVFYRLVSSGIIPTTRTSTPTSGCVNTSTALAGPGWSTSPRSGTTG